MASVVDSTITITGTGSGGSSISLGSAASAIDDEFYSRLTYTGDWNIRMGSSTDVTNQTGLTNNSQAMTVTTGSGSDRLLGGDGADTINGGAGNDSISGGSGGDLIIGGLGVDLLVGGQGNDVYQFAIGSAAAKTFYSTSGSGDTVYFRSATGNLDKFDFTGSVANTLVGSGLVTTAASGIAVSSMFASSNGINVVNFSYASATVGASAGTVIDWKGASGFSVIYGGGSGLAGGNYSAMNSIFSGGLSSTDWASGYGLTWSGNSGGSAAVYIEGSAGAAWVVLLEVTGSGAITALTTANVAGVIELSGFSGGLSAGDFI
jgi:hypothetical protein